MRVNSNLYMRKQLKEQEYYSGNDKICMKMIKTMITIYHLLRKKVIKKGKMQ